MNFKDIIDYYKNNKQWPVYNSAEEFQPFEISIVKKKESKYVTEYVRFMKYSDYKKKEPTLAYQEDYNNPFMIIKEKAIELLN